MTLSCFSPTTKDYEMFRYMVLTPQGYAVAGFSEYAAHIDVQSY